MYFGSRRMVWLSGQPIEDKRKFGFLAALTVVLAFFMTRDAILLQTLIEAVQTSQWSRFWVLVGVIALYLPVQAIVYFVYQARAEEYANLLTRQVREDLFDRLGTIRLTHFTREGADK